MAAPDANSGAPQLIREEEEREASVSFRLEPDDAYTADHSETSQRRISHGETATQMSSRQATHDGDAEPCSKGSCGEGKSSSAHFSVHHDEDDAATRAVAQQVLDAPTSNVVETQRDNAAVAYFKRLKGAGKPGPKWFVWSWDAVPAFVFTAITLMVLGIIEAFGLQPYDLGLQSYLPSFGASCCLVMCLLTSPGAQPRALVPTHIVGAFLGVSWAHITKNLPSPLDQQLACAFAVSILTVLMLMTGTFQPSASATTCLAAFHLYGKMKDQGFMFMVAPATVGPLVVVFLGWVLNNLVPWRHCYPVWW